VTLTVTGPVGTNTVSVAGYIVVLALDNSMISGIHVSGSDVLISFTSIAGQFYRLEYTDSLSPALWITAVDSVPGTGNIVTASHPGGAGARTRFYRIRQIP